MRLIGIVGAFVLALLAAAAIVWLSLPGGPERKQGPVETEAHAPAVAAAPPSPAAPARPVRVVRPAPWDANPRGTSVPAPGETAGAPGQAAAPAEAAAPAQGSQPSTAVATPPAAPGAQAGVSAPSAGQESPAAAPVPADTAVADESPGTVEGGAAPAGDLVDLNSASVDDLNALGGGMIGKAIVRGRPYATPDELLSKRVLNRATYEQIKDRITAR